MDYEDGNGIPAAVKIGGWNTVVNGNTCSESPHSADRERWTMRVKRTRLFVIVGAGMFLACGALLALLVAASAWAQPAPATEQPMDPDLLHHRLMQELTQVWTQVLDGMLNEPEFGESPEAEALWERAEALQMVRHEFFMAMEPGAEFRPGADSNGRFQFVEWIQPGALYWVLDSRTGELQTREAPPIEPEG